MFDNRRETIATVASIVICLTLYVISRPVFYVFVGLCGAFTVTAIVWYCATGRNQPRPD